MDTGPSLCTDRLIMRPFASGDVEHHFEVLVSDLRVARYLPGGKPGDMAAAMRITEAFRAHWLEHGYGVWAVEDMSTGRFIGRSGLKVVPELGEVELLYAFDPDYWGRGLASEAAAAAIRYGIEEAGLETIIGLVMPENSASRRVLEKTGMVQVDHVEVFGITVTRFAIEAARFSWPGGRYEPRHSN